MVIAALRSTAGASHQILLAIHRNAVTPVLSVPLAMEYDAVCKRPGLLPHLSNPAIDAILDQICRRADEQKIYFRWRPFLPDPNDDMLVELAIAANVTHIVTSNLHDIAPARSLGINVVEPGEFFPLIPTS